MMKKQMIVCNQQHTNLPGMFLRFASCLHGSWFRIAGVLGMLRECVRSQAHTCCQFSAVATRTKRRHCLMKALLEEQLGDRALVALLP